MLINFNINPRKWNDLDIFILESRSYNLQTLLWFMYFKAKDWLIIRVIEIGGSIVILVQHKSFTPFYDVQ